MRHTLLILPFLAVAVAGCDDLLDSESRLNNTEWIVYEWEARSACSCDPYDDWNYNDHNIILDEMFSLYDYHNDLTQVRFYPDNTFVLIRAGRVVLRGDVRIYSSQIVFYSYSDRLSFDIVREQSNTLVLYTQGNSYLSDVEVVMRKL